MIRGGKQGLGVWRKICIRKPTAHTDDITEKNHWWHQSAKERSVGRRKVERMKRNTFPHKHKLWWRRTRFWLSLEELGGHGRSRRDSRSCLFCGSEVGQTFTTFIFGLYIQHAPPLKLLVVPKRSLTQVIPSSCWATSAREGAETFQSKNLNKFTNQILVCWSLKRSVKITTSPDRFS